jgi:Flp pilus assembly protein TadG
MRKWLGRAADLLRDRRGGIAVMSALIAPVLIGSFGLGAEAASWYVGERHMQAAADSAAIAAATNDAASYLTEAQAVASQYGYTNGTGGVTVTASNAAACPGGGNTCFSVTVSKKQPLFLAQIAGYGGDTTLSGSPAKLISATSVAQADPSPRPYCLLALGTSGVNPAMQGNGIPFANLSGCNVMSNTGSTCNGHNSGADIGDAHLVNNGCGNVQHSGVPAAGDPYAAFASNIPANNCGGSYPQEPSKKNDPALPNSNLLSGSVNWSGTVEMCGDVQLTGPLTINTTGPAVLVIENGQLDTNGYTLQSSSGSALTVIFSGTSGSYTHAPTGGGTLDFAAPTSGTWSGVAIYQDPALTSGVDIAAAGNSPTWDITGAVYLPHASVVFKGAVNKASNGHSCFTMVADNMTFSGTADILARGECAQAGVTMPTAQAASRGVLVS